jgi:DMSO/TMAO reductase YedYZ molybdopterin-dependent catalytic subunit
MLELVITLLTQQRNMGERFMRQWKMTAILLLAALLAVTLVSGCTSSSPATNGLNAGLPDSMDYSLTVTGGTTSPLTLSYADLKAMDLTEIDNATTVNSAGTATTGNYIGVPMMAILNKAGLPQGNITYQVSAIDGYTKIYSADQIKVSILGLKENGTAMIADINDKVKCIRMIVPGETNDMWIKLPTKIAIVIN